LQLTQTSADSYDVLWKSPALDENTPLKVRPVFPAGVTEHQTNSLRSAVARLKCPSFATIQQSTDPINDGAMP